MKGIGKTYKQQSKQLNINTQLIHNTGTFPLLNSPANNQHLNLNETRMKNIELLEQVRKLQNELSKQQQSKLSTFRRCDAMKFNDCSINRLTQYLAYDNNNQATTNCVHNQENQRLKQNQMSNQELIIQNDKLKEILKSYQKNQLRNSIALTKQNNHLKTQISELLYSFKQKDYQNDPKLLRENNQLLERNINLQQKINKLIRENQILEKKNIDKYVYKSQQYKVLQWKINNLFKQNQQLKIQTYNKDIFQQKYETKIKQLLSENKALRQQLQIFRNKMSSSNKEFQPHKQLTENITLLLKQNQTLKSKLIDQNNDMLKENKSLLNKIAALSSLNQQLNMKIFDYQSHDISQENTLISLKKKIAQLDKENLDLRNNIGQKQKEIDLLKTQYLAIQEELKKFNTNKNNNYDYLQNTKKHFQLEIMEITDGINDKNRKISLELDNLQQRIDFNQRKIQHIGQNKNYKQIQPKTLKKIQQPLPLAQSLIVKKTTKPQKNKIQKQMFLSIIRPNSVIHI